MSAETQDLENSDSKDSHAPYGHLQDYEQYSGYPSSSIYVSKQPAHTVAPHVEPQCSYQTCTLISTKSQLPMSSQDLTIGNDQSHGLGPTVRFMNSAQYDELLEYGIASGSACPVESHYGEDTTSSYGYASETNYVLPGTNVNANLFSRPMLFNTMNDAELLVQGDGNDLQSKLSQIALNPLDGKRDLIDNHGGDIFPAMRWRDPNLTEVISFLSNPNNDIKANAAAYLQHLCYMDDPNKQRTRQLGGIPPLIRLLSYEIPEIHKNACGALRNLSYGRQNDENKRAIKNAGGIPALVNLLCKTQESEVKELVTGVLWNMSSCEDIKRDIIEESLSAIVINVMRPHSGWDPLCPGETCFSTVFRNASGVLRNVSSAGEHARTSLRNCEHLIECLFYVVKAAIEKSNIGNKTVENCVCILRNLSYRCQEVEDPNYDKQPQITHSRSSVSSSKGENLGCFGTSKKKKESSADQENSISSNNSKTSIQNNRNHKGYEQLWQPEVVQYYLALLQSCSNPETLEAAAGAIQNLAACYWQPSIDIRATVRKEKGLPILVELLRMEVDRVVCAVATALRNLAIDQRNKELIGKYAMRDLVQKLPSGIAQHDQNTSDDTISAVLATINEVIKKNPEFSRSLLDAGGVDRLMYITRHRQKYTSCVIKFASQVLFTMWQHHELRDVYKKNGWKEQDFVSKSIAASNASHNSPNNTNNTLNRPMASQGRTRYEDRTIQRAPNISYRNNIGTLSGYSNESPILCQMVDDVHLNGGANDGVYQRDAHEATLAMYAPAADRGQNQAN